MKKEIQATGPNGTFKGTIKIHEGTELAVKTNPSDHEQSFIQVKVYHVNVYQGITNIERLSRKNLHEHELLIALQNAERELMNLLTDKATQKKEDIQDELLKLGYK